MKNKVKFETKERKQRASSNVANAISNFNFVQQGKSFASHFQNTASNYSQDSITKPPIIQEFLKIAKILCEPQTLSLEEKIENFIKNYKNLSKEKAAQQCRDLLNEVNRTYDP